MEALIIQFVKDHLTPILPLIQLCAVILGMFGLLIAWLNFRRKSNVEIHYSYSLFPAHQLGDSFIYLINEKDRTTVITNVILVIGNIQISLDSCKYPMKLSSYDCEAVRIPRFANFFSFEPESELISGSTDLFSNDRTTGTVAWLNGKIFTGDFDVLLMTSHGKIKCIRNKFIHRACRHKINVRLMNFIKRSKFWNSSLKKNNIISMYYEEVEAHERVNIQPLKRFDSRHQAQLVETSPDQYTIKIQTDKYEV